jgi:beta-galactosidase
MPEPLAGGGAVIGYREFLDGAAVVVERTASGDPVLMRAGKLHYLGGWLDDAAARRLLGELCRAEGLETLELPDGVRVRDTGTERFWFNYDRVAHEVAGVELPAAGVLRLPTQS